MAPLRALTLAWAAVNRVTINGNMIDAAWIMRWEDRIGSIRAEKRADFAVLGKDPYRVDPTRLKDIPVWDVVFIGLLVVAINLLINVGVRRRARAGQISPRPNS